MDNKEILEKLKSLNGLLEDYLDMMAMSAVESEDKGQKKAEKKEAKK